MLDDLTRQPGELVISVPHPFHHKGFECFWFCMSPAGVMPGTKTNRGLGEKCGGHSVAFEQVVAAVRRQPAIRMLTLDVPSDGDLLDQFVAVIFCAQINLP